MSEDKKPTERRQRHDGPQRLRVRLAASVPPGTRRYRAGLGPFTHESIEVVAELDQARVLQQDPALVVESVRAKE